MAYGYTLTAAGRMLLLQLQAGNTMTISRIAVGDGEMPPDTNPATLTSLVHEVERSQATCTVPIVETDTLSFEVEYRNKWDDETFGDGYTDPDGLNESFWLKEYGVFALDSNGNEIMLYYANLGDFPEPVAKWNGRNLVSKRYPVSISIVYDDTDVQLSFPTRAYVTSDYLDSIVCTLKDEFLTKYDDIMKKSSLIHVSPTEPEDWKPGEWWYQSVNIRQIPDDNGAIVETLNTIPYDPNRAYHIVIDGGLETVTNFDNGSLIVKEI